MHNFPFIVVGFACYLIAFVIASASYLESKNHYNKALAFFVIGSGMFFFIR